MSCFLLTLAPSRRALPRADLGADWRLDDAVRRQAKGEVPGTVGCPLRGQSTGIKKQPLVSGPVCRKPEKAGMYWLGLLSSSGLP